MSRREIPVPTIIEYEEFCEKYKPIANSHIDDAPYGGRMHETYGEELDTVRHSSSRQVWTLKEEDGHTFIEAGYHIVNRLGYFVTQEPWEHENIIVYVTQDDEAGETYET